MPLNNSPSSKSESACKGREKTNGGAHLQLRWDVASFHQYSPRGRGISSAYFFSKASTTYSTFGLQALLVSLLTKTTPLACPSRNCVGVIDSTKEAPSNDVGQDFEEFWAVKMIAP